ncbi:DUF411 domain-containing protein [Litoribrevibacter albus]|uniref:DUF411 domain-containing protein n=1 Tax=Litoribrevibacter albus TaxID=1473156 RepID=A0AA37S7H6_9GAMM|nr:DUF411 domain-containing protein [Litoribrevibacter albus]GLQ29648.1 hypothetical protein GCM10007876_01260 [Litoribrevibacter albus]
MKPKRVNKPSNFAAIILSTLVLGTVVGCSNQEDNSKVSSADASTVSELAAPQANLDLNVYKSPTCGCCGAWVDHLQAGGLQVKSHNVDNLTQLKAEKGLKPEYRSCHTAVSRDGYIFEGHVPVEYVQQFLKEQPEGALGLSVPGMPVGSPGMEMGDRIDTYQVLKINLDGSAEVYATVQGNH